MKMYRLGVLVVAAGFALAACGSTGTNDAKPASASDGYGAGAPPTTAAPPAAMPTGAAVKIANSKLGAILVDAEGRTLYGFTDDANGTSTCYGACAAVWPSVTASGAAMTPVGLDAATFSTAKRSDGTTQLKVGKWPVYRYAGDVKPGDVNGQGSGGTWFVLAPDASLIKA